MYKIAACKNVEARIDYFLKDKELDENERAGVWMGQGARVLGLIPNPTKENPNPARIPVNENDLRAVLQGYAPSTAALSIHRRLNGRYYPDGKRRCAYDCVLSSDKSISVAALCLPNEHNDRAIAVRTSWIKAVENTLSFMEELARRGNGKKIDVPTHSLVVAGFNHFTSRRNDPQLHTHLLVANTTYDNDAPSGRKFYALEPLQLYKQAQQIDLVFQRELLRQLRATGLNATMKQVDKRTVASLPVDPSICQRLSKAHRAIEVATALRWNRAERSPADCRAENIINERCRPAKSGLLASRAEVFERALTREEANQIVRKMGQPLDLEGLRLIVPPPTPPNKVMDALIRDAGRAVRAATGDFIHLSNASLVAASSRLDVPFLEFYDHARKRLPMLLTIPSGVKHLATYINAQHKFWNEQVDWFGTKHSKSFMFPVRDKNRPVEANTLLPLDSVEPEPLAAVPEPERAEWVTESLAARKLLREKLDREARAAERARLEQERLRAAAAAAAAEEAARRIRVLPEPPSPPFQPDDPLSPSGISSRSSPLEYGEVLLSADQPSPLQTLVASAPLPSTSPPPTTPEATNPSLPETAADEPQPLPPDQPGPDVQTYLLEPEEPQAPRPRGP